VKIAKSAKLGISVLVAACMAAPAAVRATEGGGSTYPMGAENYMTGAMPPTGFYTLLFASRYSADELKDSKGNTVPVNFKVTANALAPRFVWVTDAKLFGGQVAHAMIVPVVDLDVRVNTASQSKTGLGDIIVTALALGYHHSPQVHSVVALDVMTPTGSFDKNALANIGRNYWAIQPVYTATRVDPAGLNWDVKLMYDINFKNKDTNYKSGHELHADYSLGYGLGNNWVVGMGGYGYRQTTGDELNGIDIGNKGRAFAFGPSLKYDNGKGFFVTVKYQKEMNVRNRAEGGALWVKATIPL
jgi:hypothetical protein